MTADTSSAKAYLVESIPMGLEDLIDAHEVYTTGEVLTRLTRQARKSIDITAMYWNLKPNPARRDERGFTVVQLEDEFGAGVGRALHEALREAAGRGVALRIVESPGFDSIDNESEALRTEFPSRVDIRQIDLGRWYDGGIMHQKIWVFDGAHVYLGSANNDWKSLTQVKELGVAVEHSPSVAEAVTRYFNTWWEFCGLEPQKRSDVVDPVSRIVRTVPAWSNLVPRAARAGNPLDRPELRAGHDWNAPLPFGANGKEAEWVLAGSPPELCVGGRVADVEALVRTITEAEERVCINVMDFAPVSLFRRSMDGLDGKPAPVWWPTLFDAIVHVVTTKALHVRMLVSEWEHTSPFIGPYLEALQAVSRAGAADSHMAPGKLEVRRFRVPGWERTEAKTTPREYPGHTRVNHTKYIVTDRRINVGTSNMTWDYFVGTAGASFNTTHPDLIAGLQALFDRDWQSAYAVE